MRFWELLFKKSLIKLLNKNFADKTMYVGSIKNNCEYFSQASVSFEGSAKECENISEKESLKSNNETDFVEAVERGIDMQNSLDMSEKGKSDVGEEMMEIVGALIDAEVFWLVFSVALDCCCYYWPAAVCAYNVFPY